MTLFAAVLHRVGLSPDEAASYLERPRAIVQDWAEGRNAPPREILTKLWWLAERQEEEAQKLYDLWFVEENPGTFEIPISADSIRAQIRGWPSAGAHMAVAARVWHLLPADVTLNVVPLQEQEKREGDD